MDIILENIFKEWFVFSGEEHNEAEESGEYTTPNAHESWTRQGAKKTPSWNKRKEESNKFYKVPDNMFM